MAGVAPQHRAGSNATTIVMVVAIAVAGILLFGLIWMFTQQEQLRKDAEDGKRIQSRVCSSAEESEIQQLVSAEPGTQKTVAGKLLAEMRRMSNSLSGSQSTPPAAAMKELADTLSGIGNDKSVPDADLVSSSQGAVKVIQNLFALYQSELKAKTEMKGALDKANTDLDSKAEALEDLNKKVIDDYEKLVARVDELQKAKEELEQIKGEEIKALHADSSLKQDSLIEAQKAIRMTREKAHKEIAKRDKSIEEQTGVLAELRAQGTAQAAEPLAIARKPVGMVVRALPGQALAHINLGKVDNVGLGMTFSVYSANERVPADGHGKATLEVVSVGERTAECRVSVPPAPDTPILPGDGVGNIVLQRHKEKPVQVVIIGDFDTDFDGRPNARGFSAIKALAEGYGAKVVDTVDANTDYVIVGIEPGSSAIVDAFGTEDAEKESSVVKDKKEAKTEKKEVKDKKDKEAGEEDEGESAKGEEDDDDASDGDDKEAADESDEDEGDAKAKADADKESADESDSADSDESKDATESLPRLTKEKETDPTLVPSERRARTEKEKYFEAIRQAELFAIPRLREEQFLNFIGIEPGSDAVKRLAH